MPDKIRSVPWGLVGPLWVGLVGLAAIGTVLLSLTAGWETERRLETLRETRHLYLARTMKDSFEAAIALGLPLDHLPRAQDILEHEQTRSGTLSIEMFDPQGRVVFGTDRSFLGDLVAEHWLEIAARSGHHPWMVRDGDADVVGMALLNSFGAPVGYLAVRYERGEAVDWSQPSFIVLVAGWLMVVAGSLAAVLARSHRALGRTLFQVDQALAGTTDGGDDPLSRRAAAAIGAIGRADRIIDEALTEARRLDENA